MMSDDNATPEADPTATAAAAGQAAQTDDDAVARLEAENAELRDKLLRAVAEMENLRRRTAREISETRSYAIAGFARDMLTATDNLSRALMTITPETRTTADGTMKALLDGIEMTEREMQRLMGKNGVTAIAAEGEKFDPHKHQAMFEVPDPSVAEGTVVQVMQTGYAIGERVLRPAMVGVAKGGPKAQPKPEASGDAPVPAQEDEAGAEGIDKSA